MNSILEKIYDCTIIPVVALDNAKDAKALANALCEGGLPSAEITFRTDAAEEAIAIMSKECPDILVGAGTVLTIDQVEKAVAAGAKFIVTPGFDSEIVDYCLEHNIVVLPGCITPSEVAQAVKRNLEVVKFFPAEQSGGLAKIKAMAAPYGMLKFMPTGGINTSNVKEYLEFDKIFACGGSWMVKQNLISEGKFDEIVKLTKEAAKIAKEVRK